MHTKKVSCLSSFFDRANQYVAKPAPGIDAADGSAHTDIAEYSSPFADCTAQLQGFDGA